MLLGANPQIKIGGTKMSTEELIMFSILVMAIFVLIVSTPKKDTGFRDTVVEFRAGKLTEVYK